VKGGFEPLQEAFFSKDIHGAGMKREPERQTVEQQAFAGVFAAEVFEIKAIFHRNPPRRAALLVEADALNHLLVGEGGCAGG
jgi:hypothetical protein